MFCIDVDEERFFVERSTRAVSGTRECFYTGSFFDLSETKCPVFQINVPDTTIEIPALALSPPHTLSLRD
jgi:hypothetical protein